MFVARDSRDITLLNNNKKPQVSGHYLNCQRTTRCATPFCAREREPSYFLHKGEGQCLRELNVAKRKNVEYNAVRREVGKG